MTVITLNPNKALWEKGDFTRIAAAMRESGEALIAELGIRPGLRVLDLGCGDGTTALPAAQRGADVLRRRHRREPGRGRRSARAEARASRTCASRRATPSQPRATWTSDSFDLVVSIFGAMFAPAPARRGAARWCA